MAVPIQDAIASLFTETSAPIATLAASALTSIPAILVWYFTRLDKRKDRTLSREERLDKRQAEMDDDRSKAFTELRAENAWLQNELDKHRRDLLRGWDLARFWHGLCHELHRWARNLRHDLNNRDQWIKDACKRCADYTDSQGRPLLMTPGFEPAAPIMAIPMGLEDPRSEDEPK